MSPAAVLGGGDEEVLGAVGVMPCGAAHGLPVDGHGLGAPSASLGGPSAHRAVEHVGVQRW